MSDHQYKISQSFKSLNQSKKLEYSSILNKLQEKQQLHPTRKKSKDNITQNNKQSLFKLNPSSTAIVDDIPVQIIRQNSRQKLQSLKQQNVQKKFSIFDHDQLKNKIPVIRDKKDFAKKYNIDISSILDVQIKDKAQEIQIEQQIGFLKPSKPYEVKQVNSFASNTIFQTPILPCFASQFANKLQPQQNKQIQQKQGVWKIGKIKIKGKKAQLNICDYKFNADLIPAEGGAGAVYGQTLYQLPNWKGMWIVQPDDQLFL